MTKQEFDEQDNYCKNANTPEGSGCDKCPCPEKLRGILCTDALRNLAGKLRKFINGQSVGC